MNFSEYLSQAWQNHAADANGVALEFQNGISLAESDEQLSQLVGLITHVMGEHLGRWNEGVEQLESLKTHPVFIAGTDTEKAIFRSCAALRIGDGKDGSLKTFALSDQVRILAVAASALSERDTRKSRELLQRALDAAESKLEGNDPANRALAITGNNLACAFEEKKSRNAEETEFMILAARTARTFWEKAGTWLEVSRAEYRMAMSYLQAGRVDNAIGHARLCLELCNDNKAGELDMFFAYEAIAKVEKSRANERDYGNAVVAARSYFDKLSSEDQSWCKSSLESLT